MEVRYNKSMNNLPSKQMPEETRKLSLESAEHWISNLDVSDATRNAYKRNLKYFFTWLAQHPDPITEQTFIRYKGDLLSNGKSPRTVRNYMQTAILFLEWVADGNPDLMQIINRCRHVKKPRVPQSFAHKALTLEEVRLLWGSITGNSLQALKKRAILALMLCTGIRVSAVVNADIGDFKRENGQRILVYLAKGYDQKNDEIYVKIPPQVWHFIEGYLDVRFKGRDWDLEAPLFSSDSPNNKGKRMSSRALSGIIKNQLRAVGLDEGYCAHGLRNTFAQNTILLGTKVHEVQAILNHSDISTTSIYMRGIERAKNSGEQRMADEIFGRDKA